MKNFFMGMLLILVGFLFLASNLGLISFDLSLFMFYFWPGLLLLLGFYYLLKPLFIPDARFSRGSLFCSIGLIAAGVITLGNKLRWFPQQVSLWSLFWPLVIIFVGVTILFPTDSFHIYMSGPKKKVTQTNQENFTFHGFDFGHTPPPPPTPPPPGNDHISIGNFYIGKEPWVLEDREITLKMGEAVVDLTKAFIKDGETLLAIRGMVGSITVLVPEGLAVDAAVQVKVGNAQLFKSNFSGTPGTHFHLDDQYDEATKKVKIRISMKAGDVTLKRVI